MSRPIGIDLGTTNSAVAFLEEGSPKIIPNPEGGKLTPSIVYYEADKKTIVGEIARRHLILSPQRTIHSIKRFMGRRFLELRDEEKRVGFKLTEGAQMWAAAEIDGRIITPEEISAEILKKLKSYAESFLQAPVSEAVITVPAYFNDSQRQATKRAAEMAKLEVLRIINEPTAASLAYGLGKGKREKVAVFDFGGGTFDISILEINEDVFEVLATAGDTALGGHDIDVIVADYIIGRIKDSLNLDAHEDQGLIQRIFEVAEKVKCELSFMKSTMISIPYLTGTDGHPQHFQEKFERQKLEELIQPILEQLKPSCQRALADAQLKARAIDEVILVGGSTRIPAVRRIAKTIFMKEPLGTVNPDEAVALGAAIQSSIISGDIEEILLLDVTPSSLGIEVEGDGFSVVIPRNSSIPTLATKKFTTITDNQAVVFVHVLQGEGIKASLNRSLAHFRLKGITPAPKEVPEIEVKFYIDANGILHVTATDLSSGVRKGIAVEEYQEILTEKGESIAQPTKEASKSGKESSRPAETA